MNPLVFPFETHSSDYKTCSLMDMLTGAWRCRVSVGSGLLGASILGRGEIASFDLQLLSQCVST